ncbi:MAG TPA: rRNA maturation RNase YbeY [Hyphomonadaceae bacterium]|nr:rRNA maturation RNase YbeY [Hyphomonadaceae bacterium]
MSAAPGSVELLADIRSEDDRWQAALGDIEALCEKALAAASMETSSGGEVSVLFTNDAEMRALNKRWRNIDKATDVLSFPADGSEFPNGPKLLGDIALGYETAFHDAETMKRPFEAHVSHLLIHGFLHLLGYDHINPEDAAVMEPVETRILAGLGWPDPYATGPYAGGEC